MWRIVGMFTLVAILGVASVPAAAALQPSGEWQTLAAGESHWYSFEYLGDGSQIEIRMEVDSADNVSSSVWTPEQTAFLAQGEDVEPVGRGSEDPYCECCLIWSGSFGEAGTYSVAVEPAGSGTADYQLKISGDGVWFPESEPAGTEPEGGEPIEVAAEDTESEGVAAAEVMAEATASEEVPVAEVTGGTGPDDALSFDDGDVLLPAGESLWYSCQYVEHLKYEEVGDKEDAFWAGAELQVWLDADPDESVTFSIWTEEQVKQWAAGEEVEPVGRGTASDYAPGDLSWAGSFGTMGKYYIVVENESSGDAYFQLSIAGGDVSP